MRLISGCIRWTPSRHLPSVSGIHPPQVRPPRLGDNICRRMYRNVPQQDHLQRDTFKTRRPHADWARESPCAHGMNASLQLAPSSREIPDLRKSYLQFRHLVFQAAIFPESPGHSWTGGLVGAGRFAAITDYMTRPVSMWMAGEGGGGGTHHLTIAAALLSRPRCINGDPVGGDRLLCLNLPAPFIGCYTRQGMLPGEWKLCTV